VRTWLFHSCVNRLTVGISSQHFNLRVAVDASCKKNHVVWSRYPCRGFGLITGVCSIRKETRDVSVGEKRFPQVEVAHFFAPPGESNVRSSFKLADGIALMSTEETGDVFKTTDGGKTWRKTVDGGEEWSIQDIRNYIRADDGRIYATTSEPALVLCSDDEGESFEIVARAKRGVFVIDRVVQEEIGGGVDLDNDRWFIPDTGKMIVPGTKR